MCQGQGKEGASISGGKRRASGGESESSPTVLAVTES